MPFYLKGARKIEEGTIRVGTDTIKAMLLTGSYTPNTDTHEFVSDVSSYEVSDSSYSRQTVTGISFVEDTAGDQVKVTANNLSFTFSGSVTFRYLVLFKDTGNNSTSPLIAVYDLGTQTVSGATVNIVWSSDGMWKVSLT